MKIYSEEEIAKQFDDESPIKAILEAAKKPAKPARVKNVTRKGGQLTGTVSKKDFANLPDEDEEDDDEPKDAMDVAPKIFEAIQAKINTLVNFKVLETAFDKELAAQCKKYGVDEDQIIEIIQNQIRDVAQFDLGITDLLFLDALNYK